MLFLWRVNYTRFSGAEGRFFSQAYEDYVLSNVFDGTKNGFYVDVGANDPNGANATLYFHKQGWSGMNFEPQPKLYGLLLQYRPKDINIQKAVADHEGEAVFYVPSPEAASATLDQNIKSHGYTDNGYEIRVAITTLTKEFTDHNIKEIDLLKIDVEGFEDKVVKGLDMKQFRPKVMMLEYDSPTKKNGYVDFEPILLQNDYILGADDGLNRYYYRKESPEFEAKFKKSGRCVRADRKRRGI